MNLQALFQRYWTVDACMCPTPVALSMQLRCATWLLMPVCQCYYLHSSNSHLVLHAGYQCGSPSTVSGPGLLPVWWVWQQQSQQLSSVTAGGGNAGELADLAVWHC